MKNLKLFSDEPEPLLVDPTRPDPTLWIRRLDVVESLSADARVIRTIEFRRGLNIINTAIHPGDDTATVGHSVGKTLLLRLIRYCLGERNFGSPAVRQAVAEHFRTGYVLAEVVVAGTPWVVARPIGFDSPGQASFAQADATIESFLAETNQRERMTPFAEALHQHIAQPLGTANLPHADRPIEWLDVLAWLSRDQACRHRSHTEWRPQGPDSRGLKVEDCHFLIRTVMDLLSPEDAGLITDHKRLLRQRGRVLHTIDAERNVLIRQQTELTTALAMTDVSSEYEMFAATAEAEARRIKESLEGLLDDEISKSQLPAVQAQHSDAVKEIGSIDQILTTLRRDEQATVNQIRQLNQQSDEDVLAKLSEQGEWCHLFDTKAEAVAKGCPGSVPRAPGLPDPHREKRLHELNQHLESIRADISTESDRLQQQTVEAERLLAAVQQEQVRIEKLRTPLRQRIERYGLLEDSAKSYRKQSQDFHKLIESSGGLKAQITQSLDQRRTADQRFQSRITTITNCFRNVLSSLLGHPTEARIELNAQGIYPRPADSEGSRGEAIGTSTTVLGFDLACLAASLCGIGHHPRFLMHDSPREADMEEAMYHRLFRSVRTFELLFGDNEPSFQYIASTTTPPPRELADPKAPFVRLTLDARDDKQRLLGIHF